MTTKLRIAMPSKQSQADDSKVNEGVIKPEPESQSSPSPTATTPSRLVTKGKATKHVLVTSIPSSPIVTSSSATTPQPEPISKRKGGNKRKFTHEYCLTCTRYGRACGGRRENEDGCAVCRDPDRSKGEKLRECLWADPENGIFDYKVARELFKKAQAEARAQRARPTVKRQQSDAALTHTTAAHNHKSTSDTSRPAGPLLQTSKPLNVLPPALQGSTYPSQQERNAQAHKTDHLGTDDSRSVTHPSVTDISPDRTPRIHRPQLSYIRVGSENGEYAISTSQGPLLVLPPQGRHNNSTATGPYYWDPKSNSWQQVQIQSASQRTAVYYTHTYRSAYDAPPAPPLQRFIPPPAPAGGIFNARDPASPTLSLDKSGTPPRKWSASGRKITSIDGAEWNARAWTSTNNSSKNPNLENVTGQEESARNPNDGISDTSSLSTCLSMDGELAVDDASSTDVARNSTKLRLRLGNHAGQSASEKPNTFTLPGEITIEDDEDGASSSDDAELSSDESKHKTLPAKLRKILSRSRVTKVIIEGDVFEIRPRSMIPPAKIQKKPSSAGGSARKRSGGKLHKRDQRQVSQILSAESEDETDEQRHDNVLAGRSEVRDAQKQPAPIKIKLIFNRKMALKTPEEATIENKSNASARVVASPLTPVNDNEMDDSWQQTP